MLEITARARKTGKPRMQWIEDIKSVSGLSINDKSVKGRRITH